MGKKQYIPKEKILPKEIRGYHGPQNNRKPKK